MAFYSSETKNRLFQYGFALFVGLVGFGRIFWSTYMHSRRNVVITCYIYFMTYVAGKESTLFLVDVENEISLGYKIKKHIEEKKELI
ncbi:MAG: hypothetical protein ACR2F1_08985 [Nitrososphaeraceae archaeon]